MLKFKVTYEKIFTIHRLVPPEKQIKSIKDRVKNRSSAETGVKTGAEIYPDKTSNYFNRHFINPKQNGKNEGPELLKSFGIRAVPTFLLQNGEEKLPLRLTGFFSAKNF